MTVTSHGQNLVKPIVETELFIYKWFKEHTLIKIGGLFFFFGAAWFVSYAINEGWLSPELRIALGFLLAFSAYVAAWYRAPIVLTHYIVLTALGTGIVCATVAAAQMVFNMFSPLLALTLMSISLAYTLYVSAKTSSNYLSLATGAAGLVVPLVMFNSRIDDLSEPVFILLYLLLLTVGLLLVGTKLDARPVTLMMSIGVIIYQAMLSDTLDNNLLWLFVVMFSLVFFVSVTHSIIKTSKPQAADVLTMAIIGINFVGWASLIALSSSLATFVAALVLGVTGYILTTRSYPLSVTFLYMSFSAALVLVATSFLFSGYTLVLAYIIEVTSAFLAVTYFGLPAAWS